MAKISLKTQAYEQIKDKILHAEFPPGMLLNESRLCEMFSVSRTPVRDALSRLEQERLIQIYPLKGILVAPLTIHEICSFFETRLLFDPCLFSSFAPEIPENTFVSLRNQFSSSDLFKTSRTYFTASSAFLNTFLALSENSYLKRLYKTLDDLEQRLLSCIEFPSEAFFYLQDLYLLLLRQSLLKEWEPALRTLSTLLTNYQDTVLQSFLKSTSYDNGATL